MDSRIQEFVSFWEGESVLGDLRFGELEALWSGSPAEDSDDSGCRREFANAILARVTDTHLDLVAAAAVYVGASRNACHRQQAVVRDGFGTVLEPEPFAFGEQVCNSATAGHLGQLGILGTLHVDVYFDGVSGLVLGGHVRRLLFRDSDNIC